MTMPFYRCITLVGTLAQEQKEEIVRELTRIHCETTGALPRFVQIQFDEVKPGDVFQNGKPSRAIRLHGRIRAGRDADTKRRMLDAYTDLMVRVAGVPVDDVMIALVEMPHENAMEGVVRLPAPGEERPWLERLVSQLPLAEAASLPSDIAERS
jgi:phenylpyruvate tautomerase PptA (4-oxalocrotonate tautomerase family)